MIPTLQRLRQDDFKFKASLAYVGRSCHKQANETVWALKAGLTHLTILMTLSYRGWHACQSHLVTNVSYNQDGRSFVKLDHYTTGGYIWRLSCLSCGTLLPVFFPVVYRSRGLIISLPLGDKTVYLIIKIDT